MLQISQMKCERSFLPVFYCSPSDVDFCEYNGKTVINYIVGNQLGYAFLAEAEYDGTVQQMLENF